ncbi:siderophore-interacting protein [Streptomyces sp. NRRL F-5123]|uniref:siderophore-interacting protein n=1 Tax=Streptomyces sp. NRRL F-5123 TaxID=1463856 RepID=UPI0004E15881|nr:siderophore-interacting protein [Streptomyces sp. NRRL F-5123]
MSRPLPQPQPTYRFLDVQVLRTERLSRSLLRVVFGGPGLGAVVSGGRDQRLKLFLPQAGQDAPVLPDVLDAGWYARWRALDPAVRGIMRTYTVRDVRRDPDELDIDFALHGDLGPASRWACAAAPGDRVALLAPVVTDNGGVDFRPPEGTDWVLLCADETAVPAVAGILEWLPAGTPVRAWISVADAADRVEFPTKCEAEVSWLTRPSSLAEAVAACALPAGRAYAWLAGEASLVREVRRHLVGPRAFPRPAVTFTGYWRAGTTEDALLSESA